MKNYVIFNGFDTTDFGLIEELPFPNRAEKNVEFIEIDGRHGFLTLDKHNYKPVDYSFRIVVNSKEKLDLLKTNFKGSGRLFLSHNPDRYYNATVVSTITFERQVRDVYACEISFLLQPFAYELVLQSHMQNAPFSLENHTNTTARPIVKIYGTGSGVIDINGNQIIIREIGGCIILNFELEEAYDLDDNIKNSSIKGDFIELQEGTNNFFFTGDITQIEVIPNWRWL